MSEVPRFWRLKGMLYGNANGELVGQVCECGVESFPPRPVCSSCSQSRLTLYTFNEGESAREPSIEQEIGEKLPEQTPAQAIIYKSLDPSNGPIKQPIHDSIPILATTESTNPI